MNKRISRLRDAGIIALGRGDLEEAYRCFSRAALLIKWRSIWEMAEKEACSR